MFATRQSPLKIVRVAFALAFAARQPNADPRQGSDGA